MGYRRRPLSAAVARFFMHIIGIVVYGTAITAARTVGLNSGSGQQNNDTIAAGGSGVPFPPVASLVASPVASPAEVHQGRLSALGGTTCWPNR